MGASITFLPLHANSSPMARPKSRMRRASHVATTWMAAGKAEFVLLPLFGRKPWRPSLR